MAPVVRWNFIVDPTGEARPAISDAGIAVQTVEPGEYLVTLPMAIAEEFGVRAAIGGDAGFITATPGDDAGNKPNQLRVLTMSGESFGPCDFTVEVMTAH